MKLLAALMLIGIPAIGADPRIFEVQKADIRALLGKQDFRSALQKAKTLNREWPDDQTGYQLLAASQLGLGDYAEAEKSIQWMLDLRIGKADAQGWFLVAQLREVSGDIEGAIEAVNMAYNRAYPTDMPLSRRLLIYSAHLQLTARRLATADRLLQNALKMEAHDQSAMEQLALLRKAQGSQSEAVEILRQMNEPVAQARVQYELAELTGNPRDYKQFERAALELVDSLENCNRELSLYYSGVGRRPVEAERIARIEAARRHDIYTLDALAVSLWENRKLSEAKAIMKDILAIGTRDPGIVAHATRMGVSTE
jgi:tetratricopeptide (TPR) repeat protein